MRSPSLWSSGGSMTDTSWSASTELMWRRGYGGRDGVDLRFGVRVGPALELDLGAGLGADPARGGGGAGLGGVALVEGG